MSDNVVEGSGLADLNLSGPGGWGNCFENNEAATSMPPLLESKQPCQGLRLQANWEMGSYSIQFGRLIERSLGLDPDVFYGDMPHLSRNLRCRVAPTLLSLRRSKSSLLPHLISKRSKCRRCLQVSKSPKRKDSISWA